MRPKKTTQPDKPGVRAFRDLLYTAQRAGIVVDRLERPTGISRNCRYHVWVSRPDCVRDVFCERFADAEAAVRAIIAQLDSKELETCPRRKS